MQVVMVRVLKQLLSNLKMTILQYNSEVTFVEVRPSGYGNNKIVKEFEDVPCIFLENTGFSRTGFQESIDSDATCFPDPANEFVSNHDNRLEGMYILSPGCSVSDADAWYKVINVTVNKDHLLNNEIDNIELQLKKSRRPYGYS